MTRLSGGNGGGVKGDSGFGDGDIKGGDDSGGKGVDGGDVKGGQGDLIKTGNCFVAGKCNSGERHWRGFLGLRLP